LEVMVFGRIAGKTAVCDYKKVTPGKPDIQKNKACDVTGLRDQLQQLLREQFGVIRTKDGLKKALKEAEDLLKKLQDHEDSYEAWRLYNDTLTAKLALHAACQRPEHVDRKG